MENQNTESTGEAVEIDIEVQLDHDSDVVMESEIARKKQRVGAAVRKLSRHDLEKIVLAKVVEVIMSKTEAGQLRAQVLQLQSQKDKMAKKMSNMENRVAQLSAGIDVVKGVSLPRVATKPNQVRFYRTVGIQVDVDKIKAIHARDKPPSSRSVSHGRGTTPCGRSEGGQQGQGVKRQKEAPPPPLMSVSVAKKHGSKEPLAFVDLTDEDDEEPQTSSFGTSTADLDLEPQQQSQKSASVVSPPKVAAVIPKVGAIIPTRPRSSMGRVLGTSSKNPTLPPPKFVLPALPKAPPAKVVPLDEVFGTPPPKPKLTVQQLPQGITLSCDYDASGQPMAKMTNYEIYCCIQTPKKTGMPQWNKVGNPEALPLPVTCQINQFSEGARYYFIMRAIDEFGRTGPFSEPQSLFIRKTS